MRIPSHRAINVFCALAVGTAALAAYAMNGDWASGLSVLAALGLLLAFGEVVRRRSTRSFGIVTGDGDERERTLYRRAQTRSVELLGWSLAGWASVQGASGAIDPTLLTIGGIYVALWLLSLATVMLEDRAAGDPQLSKS